MTLIKRKAQGATEYAIFIAAVLAGLLALQVYYNRAIKGNVKSRADSVGDQLNTKDGLYIMETGSVASRDSVTGVSAGSGKYSNSTIRHGDISATFRDQIYYAIPGLATEAYRGKYEGGEISTSKYVTDGSFNVQRALGTSGVNDLGSAVNNGSVWNDSNL